jgi:hypothetical protein
MAFHSCQRQEQVEGSVANLLRAARSKQLTGCRDCLGHDYRQFHQVTPCIDCKADVHALTWSRGFGHRPERAG